MKNNIFLSLGFLLILMTAPQQVNGSHIAGAELTYEYSGTPNVFLVRLKIYRDCLGINAPSIANICLESISLGTSGFSSAPLINVVPAISSTSCVLVYNICPGGMGEIETHIYEVMITVPAPATDWTFKWAECCMSVANNLQNPGLSIETRLDNLNAPMNSSPYFTIPSFGNYCTGNEFYWTNEIAETDGDSMVFSLESVFDGTGSTCPMIVFPSTYIAPFTYQQPFSSDFPITIDSSTGTLHFKPNTVQICMVRILVREFRNGIEIGQTNKVVHIRIKPQCIQYAPSFTDSQLTAYNGSISATCSQQQILVTFDTSFSCQSVVPSDFRSINSLGIPNPVISAQPIGCKNMKADSLLLTFLHPFTAGDNYIWIKTGFDGNTISSECGFNMIELADTIKIIVTDNTPILPTTDTINCIFQQISVDLTDSLLCFPIAADGSDFLFTDAAGNNFTISGVTDSCNNISDKTNHLEIQFDSLIIISGPFYLILQTGTDGNTIANACGRFYLPGDTLAIFYQNQLLIPNLGPDIQFCENNPAPVLDAGITGANNYTWTLNGSPLPGTQLQQISYTQNGIYTVTVELNGCTGNDSITVTHMPYPQFQLSDTSVCDHEPLPLLIAPSYSNAIYEWYLNGNLLATASGNQLQSTTTGTYQLAITLPNGCSETDSMLLSTISTPQVNLPNTDLCANQTLVLDAGNPGATYLWTTGATTQTIVVSTTGSYGVIVTANGCVQKDTALITVYNYPAEPVVACQTGTGGYDYLYSWTPVPTAISYEVSLDGGLNWLPANTPAGPETHGLNSSISGFIVRAIGPGICSTGWPSDPTECNIIVGNIFTPNGDLMNDFFELSNIEQFPNNTVRIFNKWGAEIYTAQGYDNVKKRFEGNNSPDGVYLYLIDPGNGTSTIKGTVTISR
jgi:gliding motility-associated-like protein